MKLEMPTSVNAEYVERCQLEYERNPRSRIFAPLAESYRRLGLLDEAIRACETGLSFHPEFASGRVVYAKCLLEKKAFLEALAQLEKATELSPDNLLAHSLTGETLLELRRPNDALRAFKMALFLNPQDERAQAAVRKWEFLTADEYEESVFPSVTASTAPADAPAPASENADRIAQNPPRTPAPSPERDLERALSLADAFLVRNNPDSAIQVLETARQRLGPIVEIDARLKLLAKRARALDAFDADPEHAEPIRPIEVPDVASRKRNFLRTLLERISERRDSSLG